MVANHVLHENEIPDSYKVKQLNLFDDYEENRDDQRESETSLEREKSLQQALLAIKKEYGKMLFERGPNVYHCTQWGLKSSDTN